MARDEDDDDGLPPIGEGTEGQLEDAKKGKSRCFLLICKGAKVKYLKVKKKAVKKNEIAEAKKLGYKGDAYIGVLTGKGMELVFNLAISDGYESAPVKDKALKDFLEEKAGFKCKPSFAIVAALPDVPFDDEDLKNPLIARFLALGEKISNVLDSNPNAEGELKQTTSEIKALLQDGEFNSAEPRVAALETRLQELLSGGAAASTTASTVPPPPSSQLAPQATSPTPQSNDDTLKQKLQEALNKLVPQLKQAVVTYPEKKVELLTPVAQIKKQMDAGEFQEAKKGILAVGQLLKSVLSQTTSQNTSQTSSQPQPVDALLAEYERKLAILQPEYDRAIKEKVGDTSKFTTVWGYIKEQAAAGVYANSIKAIDRLIQAIATAFASGKKDTDVIPKNIVADRKKFLQSRWQNALQAAYAEIEKLAGPLEVNDPDSKEVMSAITKQLDDFVDELNDAILGTNFASAENTTPIEKALIAIRSYRSRINANPLLVLLGQAKSNLGADIKVSETLLSALDDIEAKLAG